MTVPRVLVHNDADDSKMVFAMVYSYNTMRAPHFHRYCFSSDLTLVS